MDGILSSKDVLKTVPFSRRHLYRLEQRGDFPTRVKVGRRKVGWRESEIKAWIEALCTGRTARMLKRSR